MVQTSGMNLLLRPSMYDSYHKVEILRNPLLASSENDDKYVTATITGNVCESCDVLATDRQILLPRIGDYVKIHDTGAYGYSMSSNYTGRLRPAEVLVCKNGQDTLIRKAETMNDIEKTFMI
ncbi:MAG: hypothetical protein FWC79_02565 [Oscillospiraceae bacterium]|nr:hypothetical protein [Oscillospiraceae bacterium]